MKKTAYLFGCLLLLVSACKSIKDSQSETRTGAITLKELRKMPWFGKEYKDYTPQKAYLDSLKSLKTYNLKIYLGLWCSDSRTVVPQVIKTLDLAGYPVNNMALILLNRQKKCDICKTNPPEQHQITLVPTFLLLNQDGTEKGRFVEIPAGRIEKIIYELSK